MKRMLTALVAVSLMISMSQSVSADGQTKTERVCTTAYGQPETCVDREVPKEKVTHTPEKVHEVEEAGFVENAFLALGLSTLGYIALVKASRSV